MIRAQYYIKGELAFIDGEDVLVKNLLLLMENAKGLQQKELEKYFKIWGPIERLDLYPSGKRIQTGCVVFKDPREAAKVLKISHHVVNGCPIKVRCNHSRHQWEFYMNEKLAYTEDRVLIRSLLLVNIARKLKEHQIQEYFELKYGCVENLSLQKSESGTRTGRVTFKDPQEAACALRDRFHLVSGCRITVRPSSSWHQPDALSVETETVENVKLSDHCLEVVFEYLTTLSDRIHFAQACVQFQKIYQRMSQFLYKSINLQQFQSLTVWDLHAFFELSGCYVKRIEGTIPSVHFKHVCSLLGQHCLNLQSLTIINNNFADLGSNINVLKMFANLTNLQTLELECCNLTNEHLQALQPLKQLKKLDLSHNEMISGWYLRCLPNSIESLSLTGCHRLYPRMVNALLNRLTLLKELHIANDYGIRGLFDTIGCKLLEFLSISFRDNRFDEFERVARLPSLKKLVLDVSFQKNELVGKLIICLVEHKSNQLEYFHIIHHRCLPDVRINAVCLFEVRKLTSLQTLILGYVDVIIDRGLRSLWELQDLREIHIGRNYRMTENGILRLILTCPKLQVIHLEYCQQLTDQLLHNLMWELQKDQFKQHPLPIQLYMTGTKVSQHLLQDPVVAAKNIIDVICEYNKPYDDCFIFF